MGTEPTALAFRPLAREDLPLLHQWLGRPHLLEWFGPAPTLAEVEAEYGPLLEGRERVWPFLVLVDGQPAGYIQSYQAKGSGDGWWEDVTDPGVFGIDQFLAHPEQLGRGLGTAMVRAFAERLFADPAVTRLQVDPSPANARAIRCYQKAGFVAVGEIQTPDGPALLMHRER